MIYKNIERKSNSDMLAYGVLCEPELRLSLHGRPLYRRRRVQRTRVPDAAACNALTAAATCETRWLALAAAVAEAPCEVRRDRGGPDSWTVRVEPTGSADFIDGFTCRVIDVRCVAAFDR